MLRIALLFLLVFGRMTPPAPEASRPLYKLTEGSVTFSSDAPLEFITATSQQVRGVIDPANQKFAFSIGLASFEGFNNPLQREHFNENFMETKLFPNATFSGKIIEAIDFEEDGEYAIRAKGTLSIHGVKRERIIKSTLLVDQGKLYVKSLFFVLLKEYNITVPRIVHQKIAKEIMVKVDVVFEKSENP